MLNCLLSEVSPAKNHKTYFSELYINEKSSTICNLDDLEVEDLEAPVYFGRFYELKISQVLQLKSRTQI